MDVRIMTVAEVAIPGIEDEDFGKSFDGTEDVGELLDRLVDNTDKEEATKAKLT